MSALEETPYGHTRYRDRLVHTVHNDLSTCEIVCTFLRIEGFEVAFSTNVDEFKRAIERRPPDAVCVGDWVGATEGIEIVRRVKSMHRGIPAFLILDEVSIGRAVYAVKSGADDVFEKPIDGERLISSVKRGVRPRLGDPGNPARLAERLTRRECQILELIVSGGTNKEIGARLNISPRTVEVHRCHICDKLGARNTADLVRIVMT